MTRTFIADASVAIGWVHPGQATTHTAAMLDAIAGGATVEVPALWPLEVANALTVLVRRRKLTEGERQTGLDGFADFRSASTTRWRHWPFRGCQSWLPFTSCRSTTPPTSSWRSDENSCWAVKMDPCEKPPSSPA